MTTARLVLQHSAVDLGLVELGFLVRTSEEFDDICRTHRQTPWIALLPPDADCSARTAGMIRAYCFDYHTLPIDRQRLLHVAGHAAGMAGVASSLHEDMVLGCEASGVAKPPRMIGACSAMRAVFAEIAKIAAIDAPVLITGEAATGKQLAAQAIHARSERQSAPIVVVNCAVLPPTLTRAELFGHDRDLSAGVGPRRKGALELAAGGTLVLDDIDALPLEQQATLLHLIQRGTVEWLGGSRDGAVEARLIATTHVDLEGAVARGSFRADLYRQLSVLRLKLPPLRERRDDILTLARYFLEQYGVQRQERLHRLSREASAALLAHGWPGNIRELIDRIKRGVVMCQGGLIAARDLGLASPTIPDQFQTLRQARHEAELAAVQQALDTCSGDLAEAARLLGTSRPTLYRLLQQRGKTRPGATIRTHKRR